MFLLKPRMSRSQSLNLQEQEVHVLPMSHQACEWGHFYFLSWFPNPCVLPAGNTALHVRHIIKHWFQMYTTSGRVVPHLPHLAPGMNLQEATVFHSSSFWIVWYMVRSVCPMAECPLPRPSFALKHVLWSDVMSYGLHAGREDTLWDLECWWWLSHCVPDMQTRVQTASQSKPRCNAVLSNLSWDGWVMGL